MVAGGGGVIGVTAAAHISDSNSVISVIVTNNNSPFDRPSNSCSSASGNSTGVHGSSRAVLAFMVVAEQYCTGAHGSGST